MHQAVYGGGRAKLSEAGGGTVPKTWALFQFYLKKQKDSLAQREGGRNHADLENSSEGEGGGDKTWKNSEQKRSRRKLHSIQRRERRNLAGVEDEQGVGGNVTERARRRDGTGREGKPGADAH